MSQAGDNTNDMQNIFTAPVASNNIEAGGSVVSESPSETAFVEMLRQQAAVEMQSHPEAVSPNLLFSQTGNSSATHTGQILFDRSERLHQEALSQQRRVLQELQTPLPEVATATPEVVEVFETTTPSRTSSPSAQEAALLAEIRAMQKTAIPASDVTQAPETVTQDRPGVLKIISSLFVSEKANAYTLAEERRAKKAA